MVSYRQPPLVVYVQAPYLALVGWDKGLFLCRYELNDISDCEGIGAQPDKLPRPVHARTKRRLSVALANRAYRSGISALNALESNRLDWTAFHVIL